MNLDEYRASPAEQERIADILRLLPARGGSVLDIGARDGYVSKRLADRFDRVIALDLQRPLIDHPRITCIAGDITALDIADGAVDCVVCAEVLEHIPSIRLATAAAELSRVASVAIVIGVPYRQDTRLGRTTCGACGRTNPPWGHVNTFDEQSLVKLFPDWHACEWSFVGRTRERTNPVSTALMHFAGNPYGTYAQEETCVHCGSAIGAPRVQTLLDRLAAGVAARLSRAQQLSIMGRPKWMHARFLRA